MSARCRTQLCLGSRLLSTPERVRSLSRSFRVSAPGRAAGLAAPGFPSLDLVHNAKEVKACRAYEGAGQDLIVRGKWRGERRLDRAAWPEIIISTAVVWQNMPTTLTPQFHQCFGSLGRRGPSVNVKSRFATLMSWKTIPVPGLASASPVADGAGDRPGRMVALTLSDAMPAADTVSVWP